MLQADIAALQQRQKILEKEIVEALRNTACNDLMIFELKYRVLFIKEQIEELHQQVDLFTQ